MSSGLLRCNLSCPVCLELFREPIQLPCGHSFCLGCINQLVAGSEGARPTGNPVLDLLVRALETDRQALKCPTCRVEFSVPPGGFTANYALKEMASEVDSAAQLMTALCVSANEDGFQVFVRTMVDKTITINGVESEHKVAQLKTKIRAKEGVPNHQQRLIFGGQQLEDERTIASYKIQARNTIHLVLRLNGGLETDIGCHQLHYGP